MVVHGFKPGQPGKCTCDVDPSALSRICNLRVRAASDVSSATQARSGGTDIMGALCRISFGLRMCTGMTFLASPHYRFFNQCFQSWLDNNEVECQFSYCHIFRTIVGTQCIVCRDKSGIKNKSFCLESSYPVHSPHEVHCIVDT